MMMSKGDGYVQFKTGWKWHLRIEGICLAADTRIMDADTGALYSIEDIYNGCLPNSVHTTLIDKAAITKTSDFAVRYNGKRDVYVMTLRDGFTIRATANHPFLTDNGWKRLDEIGIGEFIAVPGKLDVDNDRSALDAHEARLLGYFIGDGGVTCGTPRFTNMDKGVAADFIECCAQSGLLACEAKRGHFAVSNGNAGGRWAPNEVTELLRRHGVWDKYSHEKSIPDAIFCSDNDTIAEFISALWACDGSAFVSPNGSSYIEYYSTSERLVRDLALLMLRFGIRGRIIKRTMVGNESVLDNGHTIKVRHNMWVFRMGAVSDIEKFYNLAKCHGRKQHQLDTVMENVIGRPTAFKSGGVPSNVIRRIISQEWNGSLASLCREVGCVVGGKTHKTHSIGKVARLNSVLDSPELAGYIVGDIAWSDVMSIEYGGIDDTYDLHIDNTHNFIADGILVHNSGTDVNMVGLRCQHIIGDEMAFSVDICHKSRINTALPGCRWKYCGVPNGVRGTPFWRIDQTAEGQMWSRHKIPQFANPLYAPESERRKLIIDHGGEHSHTYITQVLGEWGDEVMSSFPPNTISTYNDREYHLYEWGAGFGEKSNFRDDALDTLFRNLNYPTSRCVIGWDYGVSPDPAAFALFFEEEPGEWYLRAMFILRGVQFPHQVKFVNQIAARFNIGMVCTDEAIAIQSLDSLTSWQTFDEASRSGNIMWANVNGRIELLDATGEVVLDEIGNPIKEYRKKWATDELRNSMVHAREELKYPYHIYLPDETMDPTLIDELRGTVEKRTMGGYTQYLTAKQTEGSKSPDDHRTDALRYAVLSIYSLLGVRASKQRVPFSEYKKVMGWAGGRKGWQAPWSP